jgi:hypothetical protein
MLLEAEQHCGCPDDYAPCLEAAVADALTIFLARFPSARRARGVSADASPNAIKQAAEHQIVVRISTGRPPADPRDTERV